MLSINSRKKLKNLGKRLRETRLDRDETQGRFAKRIGVSEPTLRNMEFGKPSVSIGVWIEVFEIVDKLHEIDLLIKKEEDLFEERDRLIRESKNKKRRASKRKY